MRSVHRLLCLISLAAPATLRAQLTQRDSAHMLDQARSAQFRFEVIRRSNLPRTAPYGGHDCDVVVGRMCYWNDDASDDAERVEEPRTIVNARRKLLATLDRLAAQSRADDWITGQRVRYLVEDGSDSAAVVASRECWSAKWWCGVLRGYALHAGGHYDQSEAAFDTALTEMPHDVRCRWTDITLLLNDDERDSYARLPCDQRDAIEHRFWDLAHPSYAVSGNDRRTEHFSRVLLAELSQSSANPYGLQWADDLRELLIRYGQPLWYVSSWPTRVGEMPTPTGHDRHPSFHFTPNMNGDSVHWDVRERRARERYSPPYLDTLVDLDAQFAMMKRGDSALVIAVYADSLTVGNAVLGVSGESAPSVVRSDSVQHVHVRRARAAWKGVVAGIEKFDPVKRVDARARTWIAPPVVATNAPAMSTILLYAPDTSTVESLDNALALALTANELRGNRKLGLYWEMYGSRDRPSGTTATAAATEAAPEAAPVGIATQPADSAVAGSAGHDSVPRDSTAYDSTASRDSTTHDSATAAPALRSDSARRDTMRQTRLAAGPTAAPSDVSITVTRTDGGVLKWLAQALHITPKDSRIAMQWSDSRLDNGIAARSVVLDLAQLPEGTYRITLAAGPDDAHRTTASRDIRLR